MGWEPTTTYVYDEAGRLLSSTPESEWDDMEREWRFALKHYQTSTTCQLCGMPKSVCRAMGADGAFAATSERCHVTAALARRKRADEQAEIDLPESLAYSITPVSEPAT